MPHDCATPATDLAAPLLRLRARLASVRWDVTLPYVPGVVAVLLLLTMQWAIDHTLVRDLEQRAFAQVQQQADLLADQISRVMSRRSAELRLLSRSAALQPGAPPGAMRSELDLFKKERPLFVWLGVADADGDVLAGSDGLLEGSSIARRPVFMNGRDSAWVGPVHPSVMLREPVFALTGAYPGDLADLAVPLRDGQGALRGVLTAHIAASHLEEFRQRIAGPDALARRVSSVLLGSRDEVLLGSLPPELPLADLARLSDGRARVVAGRDGERLVVARAVTRSMEGSPPLDWAVAISQPLSVVLAPVERLRMSVWLWGGLFTLLIGGAGVLWTRRLSRPVMQVLDVVAAKATDLRLGRADMMAALFRQIQLARPGLGAATPGERLLAEVLADVERLQAMLTHLPTPLYLLDADHRVVFWNHAAQRMFGWSAEETLGWHVDGMRGVLGFAGDEEALRRRILTEPGPWTFEGSTRHRGGALLSGEWRLSKVLDTEGRFAGLLVQVRDLTREREAARLIQEQADTLRAVVDGVHDGMVSVDQHNRITMINPAAQRIFGVGEADVLGEPLQRILPGNFDELAAAQDDGRGEPAQQRPAVLWTTDATGRAIQLEVSVSRTSFGGRASLTGIVRDVTARLAAEEALRQYQRDLSDLTQRLMDQERTTHHELAQTLHDRLGQTLGALRLSYDVLRTAQPPLADPRLERRAQLIDELITQASSDVRTALMQLRPPGLEEQGLVAALENDLAARAGELADVDVQLSSLLPDGVRWSEKVEYAAFMIAREGISNALKHADPRHILVELQGDASRLLLRIADDGSGFAGQDGPSKAGHLGLVGMRERAIAIGAQLSIEAGETAGTQVRLHWEPPR